MKILVLDSEGGRALPEELGHSVSVVGGADEAERCLAHERFDVVLLSSWERARIERLRSATPEPVWILARCSAETASEALRAGADDCSPDDGDVALRLSVAERALAHRRAGQTVDRELRETLELNRRIMEAMPGGIVHVLADGSIVSANAEALRVLGLSYDDLTRRYVSDFDTETIHEDGSPCTVEHYPVTRAIVTGERQPAHTIGVRRPDGSVSWAVFTAVPVQEPDSGRTAGAVVTFFDISERREGERSLRELESQLWQAQKLESLGVLAGGVAHDFNNLLAAILGNANLAGMHLTPSSPAAEAVHAVEAAAQRAADLTAQMLAYSGRGKFVVRPVALSDLVRVMTSLLGTVISKKATLECDLADEVAYVEGDSGQLQQVVMNLIVNASDALGDGAGVVCVRTRVIEATHELLSRAYLNAGMGEGPCVLLEVSDNGVGMDPVTRARAFDPFFTTKATGRGLGLAATLGIVRGHRGAIVLATEPGAGTTFQILLPRTESPRAEDEKAAPSSSLPAAVGTVLVVDDEEMVRSVTQQMLESAGYTVLVAEGGREALDLFDAHGAEIDVLVLDMTMPDMNGGEVLTALGDRRQNVGVVLCSGYSESDVAGRLTERGFSFLQKPYSMQALLDRVRRVLKKR